MSSSSEDDECNSAEFKRMQENPHLFSQGMMEGNRLNNLGMVAYEDGEYIQALAYFKKALKVKEQSFGAESSNLLMTLAALCETFLKLEDYKNGLVIAKRVHKIANENDFYEYLKSGVEFLDEIKLKTSKKTDDKENKEEASKETVNADSKLKNCSNPACHAADPKYHCSACKKVSYCSVDCQKMDWRALHKLTCNQPEPKCGMCGHKWSRTISLCKTDCCDEWICQDEVVYELGSYKLNSCSRNHSRYSMCHNHFKERHSGRWQDCRGCHYEPKSKEQKEWISFTNKYFNNLARMGEQEQKKNLKQSVAMACEGVDAT